MLQQKNLLESLPDLLSKKALQVDVQRCLVKEIV